MPSAILLTPTRFALLTLLCATLLPKLNSAASEIEIVIESVKPKQTTAAVNSYGLTRADHKRLVATLPNIQRAVPIRTMPQKAVIGERILDVELIGTTDYVKKLFQLKVIKGRFITPKDFTSRNNVAVIDAFTAKRLFPDDTAIGKNIRIGKHYFLVVGQLADNSDLQATKNSKNCIYVPLTAMQSRYGDIVVTRKSGAMEMEQYELNQIRIVLTTATDSMATRRVIQNLLEKVHEKKDYVVRETQATSPRKPK